LRFLTHPVVIALGLTNLYLLALSGPLISPAHDLVYHLIGASSSLFVPIVLYMIALWALLTGLLLLARRTPAEPGPRRALLRLLIWYGLLVTLPWSLLHTCAGFVSWAVPDWIDLLFAAASIATLTLVITRGPALLRILGTMEPVLSPVFSFFALSGVLVLSQMVWFAAQAHHLNPPTRLHHEQPVQPVAAGAPDPPPHPRIVWILLDELSYQQIYERRYPGLDLPAFDQLAAQATNFTNVVPAGEFTRNILPTLFTGIPTNRIQVDGRGMLLQLHDSVAHQWKPFNPHQTVFQDALDHGYSTGIAGWYNPYCRILPDVLDSCYWVYHEATPARLSPNRTAARNLLRPLRFFRRRVLYLLYRLHLRDSAPLPPPNDDQLDIRMHASDYHDLLTAGDHLLNDSSIDFVFLHLPIPHPFGFYDRRTNTVATAHTSYLDNLALADLYMAHVRQLLEGRHEWDQSTIIVMGDHSWRTSFIWVDAGGWTEEEDRASNHGEFDPRPGYLVKLPNQHQPTRIDQPFDAVRTRALLDALLANTLHTPTDLAHWTATP
jgi:Sulfatase